MFVARIDRTPSTPPESWLRLGICMSRKSERGTGQDDAWSAFNPNAGQNSTFEQLRPDGFLARLAAGKVPDWLQPVKPLPEDEASGRFYRVVPEN